MSIVVAYQPKAITFPELAEQKAAGELARQESLKPIRDKMAKYFEDVAYAIRMVPIPQCESNIMQSLDGASNEFIAKLHTIEQKQFNNTPVRRRGRRWVARRLGLHVTVGANRY